MEQQQIQAFPEVINFKLMLYIGLVLSETQILVNLKLYANLYYFPYFILTYFTLTTLHLLYIFISYAFMIRKEKALALECYEHFILPASVFFISVVTQVPDLITIKLIAVLFLLAQSLMIGLKIIYFSSLLPQLAQISTLNKIIRIIKLNVIAILPLLTNTQMVIVIVIGLCQAISLSAFFFKFTYQKIKYEYILLVGAFTGMVSSVQNIFQTVFSLPYLFIGELISLYFYFYYQNYVKSIVELKYINNFSNKSDIKQDDDHLACFLFINQCLFDKKRTIKLSESAKNQGIIQASTLIDRLHNPITREERAYEDECDQIIKSQVYHENNGIFVSLLQIYSQQFQQTNSFGALEFLIDSALQLQGNFINRGLIIFYRQMQRKKSKKSIFQTCKYNLLYSRIKSHIDSKDTDKQQIKYIQFSNNLNELNQLVEECFSNELKLVEYLADRDKKTDLYTDDRLFLRHNLKKQIRMRLRECFERNIYFVSNSFKFLYILYEVSIEKRYENLKEMLKKYFLASEVQKLRYESNLKNLVVLSGFNHGEIINTNENFKNHFGITLSSFGRNNISEFIPTEKERVKHFQLMSEYVEFKLQTENSHSQYQCLLIIQREINAIKLKSLENFTIAVRVYYQNQNGFNYICSLSQNQRPCIEDKNRMMLLKKDCDMLMSKGIQLSITNYAKQVQLGEAIELCEIQLNYNTFLTAELSDKDLHWVKKKEKSEGQYFLMEKIIAIERKMNDDLKVERYSVANFMEVLLLILLATFLLVLFSSIKQQVEKLEFTVTEKQIPIQMAELVHNKLLLYQQILTLTESTPYFPDNICQHFHINNISSYVRSFLLEDLLNGTDKFLSLATQPKDYGILDQALIQQSFSSTPYLRNPQTLISYQKSIDLLKSQTFSWLNNLKNTPFNQKFYSQTFPSIMLNSTLDQATALSNLMDINQDNYTNNLLLTISLFQFVSCIAISVIAICIIILRIRDNFKLIEYLNIIQNIKQDLLSDRIRQLKSSINQVHKLRANYIDNIEFHQEYTINIKCEKNICENIPLEQFSNWHLKNKDDYDMEEQELILNEETNEFIALNDKNTEHFFSKSILMRVILYKKAYLTFFILITLIIIVLAGLVLNLQNNRVKVLTQCDNANRSFEQIQQKMINIVAYNWLKVLSLQMKFDMTAANLMFNEAISSLMKSSYQTIIPNAYDKSFSDQVLYGNICSFFNTEMQCNFYRNELFTSGFSMLIPFIIKQELETDTISTDYTYYILNLCDKTWLLLQGIIPMTKIIPQKGFSYMIKQVNNSFLSYYLEIGVAYLLAILMTLLFQNKRYKREKIIREETLSLDTVSNLYSITEFKPYFNEIYYS